MKESTKKLIFALFTILPAAMLCLGAVLYPSLPTSGTVSIVFNNVTNTYVTEVEVTTNATYDYSTNYYIYGTNIYEGDEYVSNYFETNVFLDTYMSNFFFDYIYYTNIYETNLTVTNFYAGDTYASNFFATNIYTTDQYISNYFETNLYSTEIINISTNVTFDITTNVYFSITNVDNLYANSGFFDNITVTNGVTNLALAKSQFVITDAGGRLRTTLDGYTLTNLNVQTTNNSYFFETNFVNYEITTNLTVINNAYFFETNFNNYEITTNQYVNLQYVSNAYITNMTVENITNVTITTKNLTVESNLYYFNVKATNVTWAGPTNTLDFSRGTVQSYVTSVPVSITNVIGEMSAYQNSTILCLSNSSAGVITNTLTATGWKLGRFDTLVCTNAGVIQIWLQNIGGMKTVAVREYP